MVARRDAVLRLVTGVRVDVIQAHLRRGVSITTMGRRWTHDATVIARYYTEICTAGEHR